MDKENKWINGIKRWRERGFVLFDGKVIWTSTNNILF